MESGKAFIPVNLRGFKKKSEPFALTIDDEEEPTGACLDVFTPKMHVQIKMDDRALELLFDKVLEMRLQLTRERYYQRGAAHALRRRKTKE